MTKSIKVPSDIAALIEEAMPEAASFTGFTLTLIRKGLTANAKGVSRAAKREQAAAERREWLRNNLAPGAAVIVKARGRRKEHDATVVAIVGADVVVLDSSGAQKLVAMEALRAPGESGEEE